MLIDGIALAKQLITGLKREVAALAHPPTLGFVRSGDDLVAKKFVAMKSKTATQIGIPIVEELLRADADTGEAVAAVARAASRADGVIVQMPLGKGIDSTRVLETLPLAQDVDAMGERSGRIVLTPVVGAIALILASQKITLQGTTVTVVGQGRLVGAPAAHWFRQQGAAVSVVTQGSGDLVQRIKEADIVVLGAGEPGLVLPGMLKKGAVVLDAGTSEAGGTLHGDADPACAEVASLFTPVPGGIGPIAVAMIFKNLLALAAEHKTN